MKNEKQNSTKSNFEVQIKLKEGDMDKETLKFFVCPSFYCNNITDLYEIKEPYKFDNEL